MKSLVYLLVIMFCVYTQENIIKKLDPSRVILAIDLGSKLQYQGYGGIVYQPDTYIPEGAKISDYTLKQEYTNRGVKYTFDPRIYQTEIHAEGTFTYEIPLLEDGEFVLILKFCELYHTEPERRVFNLALGEYVVVQNLDIVSRVGPFAAWDEYIPFEKKNGEIYFNGQLCEYAFNQETNKLEINFVHIGRDLPKVDGLILYEGKLDETNYYYLPQFRQEWDLKEQYERDSEKTTVIGDSQENLEDEFEKIRTKTNDGGQQQSLIKVLLSPQSIAVGFIGFIFIWVIYTICKPSNRIVSGEDVRKLKQK